MYIVINNSKEKNIDPIISQLIETKQLMYFSSQLIMVGLFEVLEHVPSFVPIPIHTRTSLKHMMRHKGKEAMEEIGSFARISWKQALVEGKETFHHVAMDLNGVQWVIKANLVGPFAIHWIVP